MIKTDKLSISVVAIDKYGRRYYDHRITEIEKGNLIDNIDSVTNEAAANHLPFYNYDNRLLRICQCIQKPYLDKN